MKNNKLILPIALLITGLGAGFVGGYQYKNFSFRKGFTASTGANGTQRFVRNGTNGQGLQRGGSAFGSILSMDDKSLTIKLADGSSKIVLFSGSTAYTNTIDASKSDLKVGENVAVLGTSNSDGSVTATSIQINPKFQMGAGFQNPVNSANKTQTSGSGEPTGQAPPPAQ